MIGAYLSASCCSAVVAGDCQEVGDNVEGPGPTAGLANVGPATATAKAEVATHTLSARFNKGKRPVNICSIVAFACSDREPRAWHS